MVTSAMPRFCTLNTTLGEEALLLRRMQATEGVSALFHAVVEAESERSDIDPHEIIGGPVCVRIELADGSKRPFHGIVTRFEQSGRNVRVTNYRLELRPWLWLLLRRTNCRIFQNMTVPDIVAQVLSSAGLNDFERKLTGAYPPRTFCVQYRETDYAFVARLLEQEGIFYYFVHDEDKHTLVLADATTTVPTVPGGAGIDYHTTDNGQFGRDVIDGFASAQELHSGKYSLKDYNFEDPANPLLVDRPTLDPIGDNADLELYDYHPGDYPTTSGGERLARLRIQERETARIRASGSGCCRSLVSGHRFTLQKHYHDAWNDRQFMLTLVRHDLRQPSALDPDAEPEVASYANTFECVPIDTPFRPALMTPRPCVRGPQTAVVVGPIGEEIWVDKYGRVKVQFHWDREGKRNDSSSCWIRVSHIWAGKLWGGLVHPRVGDEVIVEFLEGDPDRPIVTGCVYNAKQMPPYALPENKTQSGFKTRSSPGGTAVNYNELRFEDKTGQEQVYLQAERDLQFLVKNNRSGSVGRDEQVSVGNNRTAAVGADESTSIGGNRTTTVGGNDTLQVGGNETVSVAVNSTEQIGALKVIGAGAAVVIKAGTSITLQCGASTLHMNQAGVISINGTMLLLNGAISTMINSPLVMTNGMAVLSTGVLNVTTGAALNKVVGRTTTIDGQEVRINS